jgi:hypothetical protein
VRRHVAPIRFRLHAEAEAAAPLEPGERVLVDWKIVRGGDWLPRLGFLRELLMLVLGATDGAVGPR